MGEQERVECIDEAMNDEKVTWEKPALKVFSIDDTAYRGGPGTDALNASGHNNV